MSRYSCNVAAGSFSAAWQIGSCETRNMNNMHNKCPIFEAKKVKSDRLGDDNTLQSVCLLVVLGELGPGQLGPGQLGPG